MRSATFDPAAFDDLQWLTTHDIKLAERTLSLVREAMRDPFRGTGKPEPLRGNLHGAWSRRSNAEHRLVYRVDSHTIYVLSCRYHYK